MTGSIRFDQMDGYEPPPQEPAPLSWRDMGEDTPPVEDQPVLTPEPTPTPEA